ncbi:MBL fold metallo-hydrolase [Paraburkholderia sp.]|uniref:MBL fold metallo-hydrolase n=1 Tax=Paraburkholderia sp. TaxID=1926495 RepID=UPI00239D3463|nr:MBL fold metallo-hydrolase [Paraburkholderia sp.]MDE1179881.1 MBL fold metallo-hydrolase [Paraburkholderia sp.]
MTLASGFMANAAYAAAPQVKTQAPGFYRVMVGDFEVTALSDGTHPFPIDTVVEGVSKQEIGRDLTRDFLHAPVQGSINAFLVNTGTKLILIDSGAGVLYGKCCGQVLANLRAAGYRPEQVDEVLLTHLHKDHVGGVIATDGQMMFPNAVVRTSQIEADYWLNADNKKTAPAFLSTFFDSAIASVAPYVAAGRFKPFSGDVELEPGIRAIAVPGHTPGHTAYLVESGAKDLLVWGDIVHVAAIQLQNPKASVEYDTDAQAAQRSRRFALKLAASHQYLVGAAHIAYPGLGHIRQNGRTYDWVPVNYEAAPGR